MKTAKRILVLISVLVSGCYAATPVGPRICEGAPVRGNEACAAWNAHTTALGCPESVTWPCPWAGPALLERTCLEDLEATATCAEAQLAAETCSPCEVAP